jgi:uncharacterized membrane protein YbhN (UPF0104 family)
MTLSASSNFSPPQSAPLGKEEPGRLGKGLLDIAAPVSGTGRRWRSRLLLASKWLVAAGLLAWLIGSGKLELGRLQQVRVSGELGLFVALVVGSMILPACRWYWLLRIQRLKVPLGQVALWTWAGYFTAVVLPGAASGDLAKGYLILRRGPVARTRTLITVLADRALGVYSLLWLGAFSLVWLVGQGKMTAQLAPLAGSIFCLLVGMTLGAGILCIRPCRNVLLRLLPSSWRVACRESFALYDSGRAGLLGCLILSVASNAMIVGSFAVAGNLLHRAVPVDVTFLVGPLIALVNCLPLTPGGIGVAETAADGLFAGFGLQGGAEIMLLVRVGLAGLALPGLLGMLNVFPDYPRGSARLCCTARDN